MRRFRTPSNRSRNGRRPPKRSCSSSMALVTGLLIAPSAYHRIVYDGEASAGINRIVTLFAVATLLLFSLALGLDVLIVFSRIAGAVAGLFAGAVAGLLAVLFWFGPA